MERLGMAIAGILKAGDIIYLFGDLGAGKTTLVRGIANGMGFSGMVSSPSFTLMNVYNTSPAIYHFDFFRLSSGDIEELGLEDYLGKDGICIIEWPQNADSYLPVSGLFIYLNLTNGDYDLERQVYIEARGAEYDDRLGRLNSYVNSGR